MGSSKGKGQKVKAVALEEPVAFRKTEFLSLSFVKPTTDFKVGIGMVQKDGKLFVSRITTWSLVIETAVSVGDEILRINGFPCQSANLEHDNYGDDGMSVSTAVSLIAQSPGPVCLVVRHQYGQPGLMTCQCIKPTVSTKMGFAFANNNNNNNSRLTSFAGSEASSSLSVGRVARTGLLADSLLQPGLVVLRINQVLVDSWTSPDEALELVRSSEGLVTIVVIANEEATGLLRGVTSIQSANNTTRLSTGTFDSLHGRQFPSLDSLPMAVIDREISDSAVSPSTAAIATSVSTGPIQAMALASSSKDSSDSDRERVGRLPITGNASHVGARFDTSRVFRLSMRNLQAQPMDRSELLSVSLRKPTPDAVVGIGFAYRDRDEKVLVVSKLPSWSLLGASQIEVGDELVRINDRDCVGLSPSQATNLIIECPEAFTIVVRYPGGGNTYKTSQCIKLKMERKLGIGLASVNVENDVEDSDSDGDEHDDDYDDTTNHNDETNHTKRPQSSTANGAGIAQAAAAVALCDLYVAKIAQNGLMAYSLLSMDDRILSINGRSVWKDHREALDFIRVAERCVTIVTPCVDQKHRPQYLSACFVREHQGIPWGFAFRRQRRALFLSRVSPTGLLGDSPILVGDKVLSINGMDCTDPEAIRRIKPYMQTFQGLVSLVVQVPEGDSSMVGTMITKPDRDTMVGIGMRTTERGNVKISFIEPQGILANSLLNVGDKILWVNDLDFSESWRTANSAAGGLTSKEASAEIKEAPKTVTIIAKTRTDTGVVVATN